MQVGLRALFEEGLEMKKLNFNKNWLFKLENDLEAFNEYGFRKYNAAIGAANRFYKYSNWEKIDLPHDFAVSLQKTLDAKVLAVLLNDKYVEQSFGYATLAEKSIS